MKRKYNTLAFEKRMTHAIELNKNTDKKKFIIKRACEQTARLDEYTQHSILSQWSEKFRISLNLLKSYAHKQVLYKPTETEKLADFLSEFQIEQNEISKEIIITKNSKTFTIPELELLIEENNLKIKHLKKLLNMNNKNITVIKPFNPLKVFFTELANGYNGEPVIHKLAQTIPAYGFSGVGEHYQKRLEYYLHKWLCKAAGQVLGIGKNDAMLLWVEPLGGSGKSYLNKWLFSLPELKQYYIRISENESFMDMKGISAQKFAIDFDELPLSAKRYQQFKSHTAAVEGQKYDKETQTYITYSRQVNFIGSTNKANRERQHGFLQDDDDAMKRRIIPIELEGRINYEYYTKHIDLYQLWAQAANDIIQAQKTGNKKLLSWETDWDDLRLENSKYVNIKSEKNIYPSILKKFPPAQNKNEGLLVSASEILAKLKQHDIKTDITPEALGRRLQKMGYIYGKKQKRGYYIKNGTHS